MVSTPPTDDLDVPLEKDDMQGILVSAFAHLPCVAYSLLRVVDRGAARRWLSEVVPLVTSAVAKQEGWSFNIAFTLEGLEALGLPAESSATFPAAMHDGGMTSAHRTRILGDHGANAPEHWEWGGTGTDPVHVLLLVYGVDESARDDRLTSLVPTADSGVVEVVTLRAGRPKNAREHFGFLDGVGQPVVAGSGRTKTQFDRTRHYTEIAAGEFVLGYCNEDNALPLSPTLPSAAMADGLLDLGKNGTFLVFRQLKQNVAGFWRAVRDQAAVVFPDDPNGAVRLASRMVGRWESGAPLVKHPRSDPFDGVPQDVTDNDFNYHDLDSAGLACPIGSHIRRANPRDALGPDPATALTSSRRHRLLRRGRSYGDQTTNRYEDDGVDRGLYFICLNTDLERQFEFVQQTWLNNPDFAGLSDEVDPIVGTSGGGGCPFSVQDRPVRVRAHGIRAHATVRGGAYWFVPGLRALAAIAALHE